MRIKLAECRLDYTASSILVHWPSHLVAQSAYPAFAQAEAGSVKKYARAECEAAKLPIGDREGRREYVHERAVGVSLLVFLRLDDARILERRAIILIEAHELRRSVTSRKLSQNMTAATRVDATQTTFLAATRSSFCLAHEA